ncbi:MAG: hypothetical protein GQ573_02570 [Gammaproteobacteria bacterium]|nr:hypothetical protein [Gammaproteobacteria bacterium]
MTSNLIGFIRISKYTLMEADNFISIIASVLFLFAVYQAIKPKEPLIKPKHSI